MTKVKPGDNARTGKNIFEGRNIPVLNSSSDDSDHFRSLNGSKIVFDH
jgi:hypothetical protein